MYTKSYHESQTRMMQSITYLHMLNRIHVDLVVNTKMRK